MFECAENSQTLSWGVISHLLSDLGQLPLGSRQVDASRQPGNRPNTCSAAEVRMHSSDKLMQFRVVNHFLRLSDQSSLDLTFPGGRLNRRARERCLRKLVRCVKYFTLGKNRRLSLLAPSPGRPISYMGVFSTTEAFRRVLRTAGTGHQERFPPQASWTAVGLERGPSPERAPTGETRRFQTFLPAPGMGRFDPNVWCGRALQEVWSICRLAVLHQCIRPLIGACCAPGHHGYQRTYALVSGRTFTAHAKPGDPNGPIEAFHLV